MMLELGKRLGSNLSVPKVLLGQKVSYIHINFACQQNAPASGFWRLAVKGLQVDVEEFAISEFKNEIIVISEILEGCVCLCASCWRNDFCLRTSILSDHLVSTLDYCFHV
jgi:hypothetical protein